MRYLDNRTPILGDIKHGGRSLLSVILSINPKYQILYSFNFYVSLKNVRMRYNESTIDNTPKIATDILQPR